MIPTENSILKSLLFYEPPKHKFTNHQRPGKSLHRNWFLRTLFTNIISGIKRRRRRRRSRPTAKPSDHEVVRFEIAVARDRRILRRWFLRNWIPKTRSFPICYFLLNLDLRKASKRCFRIDISQSIIFGLTPSASDHFVVGRLRRRRTDGRVFGNS